MNEQKAKVFNKTIATSECLYAYKRTGIRFKKFIFLPLAGLLLLLVSRILAGSYIVFNSIKIHEMPDGSSYIQYGATQWIIQLFDFLGICLIISIIVLMIPRVWLISIKLKSTDQAITLYKTIHRDEAEKVVSDINLRIKDKNLIEYP